jgi:hypothetical protein
MNGRSSGFDLLLWMSGSVIGQSQTGGFDPNGPDTDLFHPTLHSTFATRSVVINSRAMDP